MSAPARSRSCCGSRPTGLREVADLPAFLAGDADAAQLVALLAEDHPLYAGLGGAAVVRVRAQVFEALAARPCVPQLAPHLLEELHTAFDARLAAWAARLVRSVEPKSGVAAALAAGLNRIRNRDEPVHLRLEEETVDTTAVDEILGTLEALGSAPAAVIAHLERLRPGFPGPVGARLEALVASLQPTSEEDSAAPEGAGSTAPMPAATVQDHAGRTLPASELFGGGPTFVVFFYTRCDNPAKCPRTITELARLQRELADHPRLAGLRTVAITYDPDYDLPVRMAVYARTYGAVLSDRHRFVRVTDGFDHLSAWFELGVGYSASIVNRHRLEAHLVDARGVRVDSIVRRAWTAENLVRRLEETLGRRIHPIPRPWETMRPCAASSLGSSCS